MQHRLCACELFHARELIHLFQNLIASYRITGKGEIWPISKNLNGSKAWLNHMTLSLDNILSMAGHAVLNGYLATVMKFAKSPN